MRTLVALAAATLAVSTPSHVIRLALLPLGGVSPATRAKQAKPLADYLERQTGYQVDVTVGKTYADVLDQVVEGKVDMAHLGGYLYVQAHEKCGVVPLVQTKESRDISCVFVTHPDSGIHDLNDLIGKTWAFGDPKSTSGYVMPNYFLDINDLPVRSTFKSVVFSGSHWNTLADVASYKVDAGAVEIRVYQNAMRKHEYSPDDLRVFWTTPSFPDNVWAVQKTMPRAEQSAIQRAFLELTPGVPADVPVLKFLDASGCLVPRNEEYSKVRDAVHLEGLLLK